MDEIKVDAEELRVAIDFGLSNAPDYDDERDINHVATKMAMALKIVE